MKTKTLIMCMSAVCLSSYIWLKYKRKVIRRTCKVRYINRDRKKKGFYTASFLPMKMFDEQQFFKYTRMNKEVFDHLLALVKPHLKVQLRCDTVSAEEHLALTLHYLSQGSSMQTIAWTYKLGITTVHKSIHRVCTILWDVLFPIYVEAPNKSDGWKKIASDFARLWNFPNCLGAIDGKHINLRAPSNSGSLYFNYKKNFSVVLMAACDANYFFTLVDVGGYGSSHDSAVFKNSSFGVALENNNLNIPRNSSDHLPYVFVADEAFPMKSYIMRPFPGSNLNMSQRIFNYRLSRARRCIENAFGVLAARWRILYNNINANVENVDTMVKACVALHNFVKHHNSTKNLYCPASFVDSSDCQDGGWRQEIKPLQSVGRLASNNAARHIYELRERLARYFTSEEGSVPWQQDKINEGRNLH